MARPLRSFAVRATVSTASSGSISRHSAFSVPALRAPTPWVATCGAIPPWRNSDPFPRWFPFCCLRSSFEGRSTLVTLGVPSATLALPASNYYYSILDLVPPLIRRQTEPKLLRNLPRTALRSSTVAGEVLAPVVRRRAEVPCRPARVLWHEVFYAWCRSSQRSCNAPLVGSGVIEQARETRRSGW
jgi:hypothetical protein